MAVRPSPWPRTRHQLLPHTLFSIAEKYPDVIYAEFPRNPLDIKEGYRTMSFGEIANAVNSVAWWLEENVGKLEESDKTGKETLVYNGPNDIRYMVLCLGSVLCGYKMLFPSPRYSATALIKLIESVDAKVMLLPETSVPVFEEVLEQKKMKALRVPAVEWLLTNPTKQYPYTKKFEDCKHEPFVCLHTSGTTGFPKPIIWTHDWVNSMLQTTYLDPPSGYQILEHKFYGLDDNSKNKTFFMFPPFHGSGMFGMVFFPLGHGVASIYPPTSTTPEEAMQGALAALEVLAERDAEEGDLVVDIVATGPPNVEYLGKHPEVVHALTKYTDHVGWGGGRVSRATFNSLNETIKAVDLMASTEQGIWPRVLPIGTQLKGDSVGYTTPHPALNIRFDPVSKSDGTAVYEAVMIRNNGKDWDGYIQPIFRIFTDVQEKRMGDLYTKHPQDPNLVIYHGRADDMLVFITTEKFHAPAVETKITGHPGVAEVMMVGTRRPKAALILRLEPGAEMEDVWKVIEETNKTSPVYARVQRNMILLTEEPFIKTPKGTIQKREMLDLYAKELDSMYEKASL